MTTPDTAGLLLGFVLPLAAVSLAMVYAMIQWSRALLAGGGGRAWAVAYVAVQLVRGLRRADVRTGGAPPAGSPPDGPRSRRGRR